MMCFWQALHKSCETANGSSILLELASCQSWVLHTSSAANLKRISGVYAHEAACPRWHLTLYRPHWDWQLVVGKHAAQAASIVPHRHRQTGYTSAVQHRLIFNIWSIFSPFAQLALDQIIPSCSWGRQPPRWPALEKIREKMVLHGGARAGGGVATTSTTATRPWDTAAFSRTRIAKKP